MHFRGNRIDTEAARRILAVIFEVATPDLHGGAAILRAVRRLDGRDGRSLVVVVLDRGGDVGEVAVERDGEGNWL